MDSAGMWTAKLGEILETMLTDAAEGWLSACRLPRDRHAEAVRQSVGWLAAAALLLALAAPLLMLVLPLPLALSIALFATAIPLAATGILATTGRSGSARLVALLGATIALTALITAAGGLSSPLILVSALVPIEAALSSRSRGGLCIGLVAGLAVPGAVALAGLFGFVSAVPAIPVLPVDPLLATAAMIAAYSVLRGAWLSGPAASAQAALKHAPDMQAPAIETTAAADPAEATRRQHDLMDHMPGLVTLHDANGSVAQYGGADASDFLVWMNSPIGNGYLSRIHVSDRILFLDAFARLRRGEKRVHIELRMERQDGSPQQFVHLSADLIAQRDAAGTFTGAVVQSHDISEVVASRAELAATAHQAETANEAKTRFLAAVSHELRTPLNAIIGFSDMLAREFFGPSSDPRQREYAGLIHTSGHHLLSLVNTMLDMSKIEAGRYELFTESFAIGEAVASCESMLGLQASEKGVSLARRIARDAGEIVADRRAIQQILINLVGNAIKFTEAGGVVTTDVERRSDRICLSVSDTGIGIPAADLERIGEPFRQGEASLASNVEGTGLGLSLVKGLVTLHGGRFAITSREGEGTRVSVELPLEGQCIDTDEPSSGKAVSFPPRLTASSPIRQTMEEKSDDAAARLA
ncbi:sensor histidine kinase [Pseudohoeflea coraliihabitans]|uniref:histidine kinase n=1 Tax=Pseudohoeflea coraliihabitans TaxID=2860393 RepID=A0ABS6WRQ7_9HYPH|nr:PAS domain-containing sensor histidine kinase [Pseudohoeflea sp. DP4N28-3]MBW3098644.1 PAS domain-containing sensor histidine kinase [Pseudohoeflea sp. DP4N28-3]